MDLPRTEGEIIVNPENPRAALAPVLRKFLRFLFMFRLFWVVNEGGFESQVVPRALWINLILQSTQQKANLGESV